MLPFRRTFENEKVQMQELNRRLSEYLSRVKQLEQENSVLIAEINAARHDRALEREQQYKAQVRELRSAVAQLAFDASQAEVQRDTLRREAQLLEALLRQESGLRTHLDGELDGCKAQLQQSCVHSVALEERLLELEDEYRHLEDEHGRETALLREVMLSRGGPAFAPGCRALPALTVEEMERHALGLSESCAEAFEGYRRRVQELEECVRADEAKVQEHEREKMLYAAELQELRCRAEEEGRAQARLEEQLERLRESAAVKIEHFQLIIEELEQERILLANAIAEKLKEHQELMQVKIGLALEVATYRALLEGEQKDIYLQIDRYAGEAPRKTGSSVTRQERRKLYPVNTGFETRYMEQTRVKTTPVSTQFKSSAVSRALPVTVPSRDYRSPPNRRDMLAFSKASEVTASSIKPDSSDIRKNTIEEKVIRTKEMPQNSAKKGVANKLTPIPSPTLDQKEINVEESNKKYVRVVSPPMMSLNAKSEKDSEQKVLAGKATFKKEADINVTGKQGEIPGMTKLENVQGFQNVTEVATDHLAKKEPQYVSHYSQVRDEKDKSDKETKELTREDKVVEMVCLEEIIEKVMKPAGLDTKLSTSPDSKVVFHVEKMEEEDGTAKTQIILESKVEEDLDVSDDSVLDELLSKGVKKVTLENIRGTPTGSMIESLLSFGLEKGDGLESKSVNVEIIEEPLEAYSDEESDVKPKSVFFQPSSKYVKIEELDNDPQTTVHFGHSAGVLKTSVESGEYRKDDSVQIQESSKDPPYFTQIQETEYFVSTPDDASEPEESGLSSYGHYGVVDDLSDEKYYQPESAFSQRFEELGSYKGAAKITDMTSEHAFSEHRYPECIIEEEIQVYPTVHKSMLEQLREETKDPEQQLRGVLEQVQGEVSETLKEELSLFTRNDQESCDKLAVDIKKMQQASDNKTMTIVAEVNVSQTLEDPRLLKEQSMSEEQVIQYDDPDLEPVSSYGSSISVGGMQEGYTVKVSKDQSMKVQDMPWVPGNKGQGGGSVNEVNKLKTHVEVGPSEKSFTFRSDVSTSGTEDNQAFYSQTQRSGETSGIKVTEDVYSYVQSGTAGEYEGEASSQSPLGGKMGKWEDYTKAHVEFSHVLETQITQPQIKTSQEKNVYFENPDED